jgi:hypothetical protein
MNGRISGVIRSALALSTLSLAAAAHAVPISIEFSGTVRETVRTENGIQSSDSSRNGQSVSGFFLLETEGLERGTFESSFGSTIQYADRETPNLVSAGLSIGGISYDIASFPNTSGFVSFFDGIPPGDCSGGCAWGPDYFGIVLNSHEPLPIPMSDRQVLSHALAFSSSDSRSVSDPLFGSYLNFEDRDYTPLDLVSLPLMSIFAYFGEAVTVCSISEERCRVTQQVATYFDITDVTRSVVSVPEPGSFGLLSGCLLMLTLTASRRRRSIVRKTG